MKNQNNPAEHFWIVRATDYRENESWLVTAISSYAEAQALVTQQRARFPQSPIDFEIIEVVAVEEKRRAS